MDSLRTEIESELKRSRLDKTRLYSILLKLIDNCGGAGGAGGVGPQGPRGPPGPPGPRGPQGESEGGAKPTAKPAAKKTVTTIKKKTTASST